MLLAYKRKHTKKKISSIPWMHCHLLSSYFSFIFVKLYFLINKRRFGINLIKFYFKNSEGPGQLC